MEFINTEQRDPGANEILHPPCNRESAMKIISKYERCKEMVKRGKFGSAFSSEIACDCWSKI